jgi:DMSO/TMAO reductase YedYZ heme-binding membrane subunit
MIAVVSSQVWWWFARASGIVAWATASAAIVWGLALSSKVVRKRRIPAWLLCLHRYLGTLTLLFVAVHLVALAADSYVGFGPAELFVPMATTWRPGAVTWGIVAFYLLLIVQVTSWAMKRLSRKLWHRVHLLSFGVFASGAVHGALAGTDRDRWIVQAGALAVIAFILAFVLVRLVGVWAARNDHELDRVAPSVRWVSDASPSKTAASADSTPQVAPLDPALAERLARLRHAQARN